MDLAYNTGLAGAVLLVSAALYVYTKLVIQPVLAKYA